MHCQNDVTLLKENIPLYDMIYLFVFYMQLTYEKKWMKPQYVQRLIYIQVAVSLIYVISKIYN